MYKAETLKPRVIVVEGIDAWTPDAKKQEAVFRVLKPLQEFAEAYNVAVICTAGSGWFKEECEAATRFAKKFPRLYGHRRDE